MTGFGLTISDLTSQAAGAIRRLFNLADRAVPLATPPPWLAVWKFFLNDFVIGCRADWDEHKYPKAVKISAASLAAINLRGHEFHGEWNYTIDPKHSAK
jgi:hypothetical protein